CSCVIGPGTWAMMKDSSVATGTIRQGQTRDAAVKYGRHHVIRVATIYKDFFSWRPAIKRAVIAEPIADMKHIDLWIHRFRISTFRTCVIELYNGCLNQQTCPQASERFIDDKPETIVFMSAGKQHVSGCWLTIDVNLEVF